jgi:hypothetical protein
LGCDANSFFAPPRIIAKLFLDHRDTIAAPTTATKFSGDGATSGSPYSNIAIRETQEPDSKLGARLCIFDAAKVVSSIRSPH